MSNPAGMFQKDRSVGMPRACMLSRALIVASTTINATTAASSIWLASPRQNGSFQKGGRSTASGATGALMSPDYAYRLVIIALADRRRVLDAALRVERIQPTLQFQPRALAEIAVEHLAVIA